MITTSFIGTRLNWFASQGFRPFAHGLAFARAPLASNKHSVFGGQMCPCSHGCCWRNCRASITKKMSAQSRCRAVICSSASWLRPAKSAFIPGHLPAICAAVGLRLRALPQMNNTFFKDAARCARVPNWSAVPKARDQSLPVTAQQSLSGLGHCARR